MKPNILIVEDEPEMRDVLTHVLRADYEVVACKDGLEALRWVRKAGEPIHLVITDLRMAEMDGYELLVKVKEETPSIPVIVVSVYFDDDPDLTEEIKKRADRLVRKPFDLMKMKQLVGELLHVDGGSRPETLEARGASAGD